MLKTLLMPTLILTAALTAEAACDSPSYIKKQAIEQSHVTQKLDELYGKDSYTLSTADRNGDGMRDYVATFSAPEKCENGCDYIAFTFLPDDTEINIFETGTSVITTNGEQRLVPFVKAN